VVKITRHLSYANVISTLALLIAVAGGTAYAVDKINSRDVVNASLKSVDLKNHRGVRDVDVKRNTLTGRQIREGTLKTGSIAKVGGNQAGTCRLSATGFVNCAATALTLHRRSRVLLVVTGNQQSIGGPASAFCHIRVDGAREGTGVLPGERQIVNTSSTSTNGFAHTVMPRHQLPPGRHLFALACQRFSGNARINTPTIAVIAIGAR